MIVLGVECQTACPACGAAVPVNALVPSLFCPSCARPLKLTGAGLAEMLRPALSSAASMPEGQGSRGSVWTPDGQFELSYTRMAARCETCGHPVDLRRASADGWLICGGCHERISVRPVPPALAGALPGVTHLFGEHTEQLAAGGVTSFAARQAAPVTCGQCGGALEVDGSVRTIACSFCGASVLIPDGVWARLHPAPAVRRWFAVIPGGPQQSVEAAGVEPGADAVWSSVRQAIADDQRVYAVGRWGPAMAVWAFDPRAMKVRWSRTNLELGHDAGLVLAGGRLIAWDPKQCAGQVFSAADGLPAGSIGGQEPVGATLHHLDFVELDGFAADADGSFIALFESRLLRFDPSGRGVPTWPETGGLRGMFQAKQRPAPLWRSCPQRPADNADDWDPIRRRLPISAGTLGFDWMDFELATAGSRPLFFAWNVRARIAVGWDGRLYVEGEGDSELALACYERGGDKRYFANLPIDDVEWGARPTAAADGTAYCLGDVDHDYRTLVQVRSDGAVRELARDRRLGGPLVAGEDEVAAASPGGPVAVLGQDGSAKIVAPDGRVLAMSERARRVLGA